MKGIAYINGNFVPLKDAKVSILDRGFRYGEGLFETVCIEEGKAIFLKEHFERLRNSAKALNLNLPLNFEQVAKIIDKLLRDSSLGKGVLNIYLTATDEADRKTNFIITVKDEIRYKESDYKKGFTAIISSIRIDSSLSINSHKTLSFLPHILAKKEVKEKGVDEAILLNTDGFVLEGTTRNIFMVKGDKLITPPIGSGILPGITRAKILQIAPSLGLKVEEKLVKADFLKFSDEVLLTSSLIEVMPVVKVDNTLIGHYKTITPDDFSSPKGEVEIKPRGLSAKRRIIGQYAVILREKYKELISGFLSKKVVK